MDKVLYVNHRKQQCGVYEFGKDIGKVISRSNKYEFIYCECDSFEEFKKYYKKIKPSVIIYNYTPTTMSWLDKSSRFDIPKTYKLKAIHIGTIHDGYQKAADNSNDFVFDFHVSPDPTLLLKNPIVFKTNRLLPRKPTEKNVENEIPVIGSFGFATQGKGFDKIVEMVQREFETAIIKFNIPFAKFGDESGDKAKRLADTCKSLIRKESIQLIIDHNYLTKEDLMDFLSKNTINVFLYDNMEERGISSAADWALASGRPVAISKSKLFRHLFNCRPSISVEESSLNQILENGTLPLHKIWNEWTEENLAWEYELIVSSAIERKSKSKEGIRNRYSYYLHKILARYGLRNEINNSFNQWTKTNDEYVDHNVPFKPYYQVDLPSGFTYNRILDNEAREIYKTAITFLEQNFPYLIEKKIREANVQQAFVLDTAVRFGVSIGYPPKILAVGAFEDTAVEALKMLRYDIDEIDPILNQDLHTYLSKPSILRGDKYDIIISTSVIEHVEKDEQFVKDISFLLKPGGYCILTCDYKDQYMKGDDIPDVDFRFYTQNDIKNRLMSAIPDCYLVDLPEWECEFPDFTFIGKYNYTFASIVFRKS